MHDPQQDIFTGLVLALRAHFEPKGIKVFDGFLPPEGTAYPFIYLADTQQNDRGTKGQNVGVVKQTIHVWHSDPHKRGTVSQILLEIKQICWALKLDNFGVWANKDVNQNILTDNTTGTPLLHGHLLVYFNFS